MDESDFSVVAGGEGDDSWTVIGPPPAPITIDDLYRALLLSGEPVRRARQMVTDLEPDFDRSGSVWIGDDLLYVALLSPDHEQRIREYLKLDPARVSAELDRLRAMIAAREAAPAVPVVESYYDYETGTWVTPETRYRDVASDPKFAPLDELISSDPERAWLLLLDLIAVVPEDILYLAAEGPFSAFLTKHGITFVDRIEAQARTSGRFRECVSEGAIPPAILERVLVAMREGRR